MSSRVLNESTGMLEQHLTPRDLMERRVMSWLNDNKNSPYRYFDCGELGTLYMSWWNAHWVPKWIEVVPVPDDLPEWPGHYILDD